MTIRTRLLLSAICAVALAASGVFLERQGPSPVSAGSPEMPISGAWSCPHGGGEGWKVWVTVTNPGEEPVEVRMTTSSGGAAAPSTPSVIEPGTLRYFEVAAPIPGSATVVEYLGGTVVAGSVVVPPEGGLAASPCAGSPGPLWYMPEASTLRGETAYLVVHNPFASQAVVDVVLTTLERQLRPGNLQGVVLGPLDARAFELNKFVLGEEAVSATVVAPQGRVAASSVIVSPGGIRSSLGVAAPSSQWILPGLGAETTVVVRALEQDAPASAKLLTEDGPVPVFDLEAISADTAEPFGIGLSDGGMYVSADGERPMVSGRRMTVEAATPAPQESPAGEAGKGGKQGGKAQGTAGGTKAGEEEPGATGKKGQGDKGGPKKEEEPPPPPTADLAATEGAPGPVYRWLVPPAVGPDGGPSVVLLHNPSEAAVAEVTVTLLGTGGATGAPSTVTIPPLSTVKVPIPEGSPVAALVEGGGVVAAQATTTVGAFAVLLGLPV